MTENHDIPAHLIPDEETVVGASDDEIELNESLDADHWAYIEEPDDGKCPYCGNYYKYTTKASQVSPVGDIDPIDKVDHNYIYQFNHNEMRNQVSLYCSPHNDEHPKRV